MIVEGCARFPHELVDVVRPDRRQGTGHRWSERHRSRHGAGDSSSSADLVAAKAIGRGAALDALGSTDATLERSVCDVADRASVASLFETVTASLGGLDVLVNNAGIAGPTGRCEDLDPEAWD